MLLSMRPPGCENGGMSVETWINLIAIASGMITLYIMLRRPIEKLETKIDERFETVDERFDAMDAKFDARIDAQDAKFEARFDAMDAKFEARFTKVDGQFGAQESKFDARSDAQESKLDARFTRLENKIDGVHRELVEFRLEAREVLARHDERITALEAQRPRLVIAGSGS